MKRTPRTPASCMACNSLIGVSGLNHYNPARRAAGLFQRIQQAAVVVAVTGRLHENRARQTQVALHGRVVAATTPAVARKSRCSRADSDRVRRYARGNRTRLRCMSAKRRSRSVSLQSAGKTRQTRESRSACAALTACSGITPSSSERTWRTVSIAWCSMADGVSPPTCGVATSFGCAASSGLGIWSARTAHVDRCAGDQAGIERTEAARFHRQVRLATR